MALELWRPRRGSMRGPWREIVDMQREMEDMFTPFFRGLAWPWREERAWSPAIDMVERKDEIVVRVDLPGLEEKDIEVSVDDGRLTIRGERKETREEKDEGYEYYCERAPSSAAFRCRPASTPTRKASFKNGVLEVHLPKAKESKPKKVEIKAA